MKKRLSALAAIVLLGATGAYAGEINLYEYAILIGSTDAGAPQFVIYGNDPEGLIGCPDAMRCYTPAGTSGELGGTPPADYGDYAAFTGSQTGFDFTSGLGSINLSLSGSTASTWFVRAYFDLEILGADLDPYGANPFYNEYATVTGTDAFGFAPSPAGSYLDWQVGIGADADGTRTTTLGLGALANMNGAGAGLGGVDPAVAFAWYFDGVGPDQTIDITFQTSFVNNTIRYQTYSSLNGGDPMGFAIDQADVPEPGAWTLLLAGVALILGRKGAEKLRPRR